MSYRNAQTPKTIIGGSLQRLHYALKYTAAQGFLGLLEMLYGTKLLKRPEPKKDPVPEANCFIRTGPHSDGIGADFTKLADIIKEQGLTMEEFIGKFGNFAKGGVIDMTKIRGEEGQEIRTDRNLSTTSLCATERLLSLNGKSYKTDNLKSKHIQRILKKGLSKIE